MTGVDGEPRAPVAAAPAVIAPAMHWTHMSASLRGAMWVLVTLVLLAVLAGCGGEERDLDAELLAAAYENDVAGADVNAKDSFNGTGLIRAAERGYATIVGRLVETDIDVDHVNRLGWTALLEAVILGEGGRPHIDTVRLLVEAGADVDIPDENGTAALAHAQRRGFTEIERILRAAR